MRFFELNDVSVGSECDENYDEVYNGVVDVNSLFHEKHPEIKIIVIEMSNFWIPIPTLTDRLRVIYGSGIEVFVLFIRISYKSNILLSLES